MSRRAVVVLLAGALCGCVKLTQPAPQISEYRLSYAPPTGADAPLPVTLGLGPLAAGAIYDRQSMLYREDPYSTGTYLRSRWAVNPAAMITDLLVRDFASSGAYSDVTQGPSLVPRDYQLSGEIEEIEETETSDACAAHLRLRVSLVRLRGVVKEPIILSTSYTADEACGCGDARALAQAMSAALAQISARLQHDVYAAIEQDWSAHRPAS